LDGNIQARDVESFEHNFSEILTILGCIERRFSQKKIMIFWFAAEIFEDAMFPISLHMSPVVNLTMSDGIVGSIGFGSVEGFISNEEIQIINTLLGLRGLGTSSLRCTRN
jgi:hypothetical protein